MPASKGPPGPAAQAGSGPTAPPASDYFRGGVITSRLAMTTSGSPTPAADDTGLIRALGLWDSTLLVIGFVLGSAVFMVTGGPGGVASLLPAPGWLIIAWVVGGIVSFAGALVYAELGAALPRAGGQYVFLREAYGDLTGFLYGWTLFAVIHTGTLAALAVGYAEYFGFFFPALGTGRSLLTLPFPGHPFVVSAWPRYLVLLVAFRPLVNSVRVESWRPIHAVATEVEPASLCALHLVIPV